MGDFHTIPGEVERGLIDGVSIGTLCCDTVEEARTLIPSLEGKVSDDDLQQVLDDISKLIRY